MFILINARFLTQPITGTQRYARELTREIIRLLGPEKVQLVAPRNAPPEFAGVAVTRCGSYLKGHPWEQVVLPWAAKRVGADILWCPGNCGPLLISQQVVTIHDAEVFAVPEGLNPRFVRWYRFLQPRLAKRVRRVITISEFSKKELMKYLRLAPEKIRVIFRSVPKNFLAEVHPEVVVRVRRKYNLPEQYIFALASRTPHKNFSSLLRAWQILQGNPALKDTGLVIAGGVTQALQEDSALERLKDLPRVFDLGYVPDEELPALYSGATVFVYPSLYEGFGLPPLEAMACGTPVVVSNAASLPEVVGNAGIYVNPRDVGEVAQSIYRVLTDETLRKILREKGLARARLFSIEREARQTLGVFEEVLREQKRWS